MELEYNALESWYVMLDTCVVNDDFGLSLRETTRLVNEASARNCRVCVSEVVIQEMTAHCLARLSKTRRDLDDARRFLSQVLIREVDQLYASGELSHVARTYEAGLRRRLLSLGVQVIRPSTASFELRDLLWRHRQRRRPFKQDGQGLADALIWQSILALSRREPRPVVLITSNTRDFANAKSDELHPQLVEDLANVGVKQSKLYLSIAAFNNDERWLMRPIRASDS